MKNEIFPHTFWRPFLDCTPQLFFRPKYVWFPIHLKGPMIPDPSGQLAELIVCITSTRVDLYSHQILLTNDRGFNIERFCSDVCGDHRRPQTLAEICGYMDICCGFRAVAAREKYPGLILLHVLIHELVSTSRNVNKK